MKQFLLTATIVMLLASSAFAQTNEGTTTERSASSASEDAPPANMIAINPLKFLTYYNLSYYRALSPNIAVGGGLQMPSGILFDLVGVSISGFGANAEMRWHPSGKALRGFYVAPNVSFNTLTATDKNSQSEVEVGATSYTVGALLGWQWFLGDSFAMGLGIGADYAGVSAEASDSDTDYFGSFDGILPALRFDIGFGW